MNADELPEDPAPPAPSMPVLTRAGTTSWKPPAARFAEGDVAILESPKAKHSQPWAGLAVRITYAQVVEGDERLLARGVQVPRAVDYVVTYPDGTLGGIDDWQLRPETEAETLRRWSADRR